MKGFPKYKIGDRVTFYLNEKPYTGEVYIVDKFGTFENDTNASYDIMVDNMLYKHITESLIV